MGGFQLKGCNASVSGEALCITGEFAIIEIAE